MPNEKDIPDVVEFVRTGRNENSTHPSPLLLKTETISFERLENGRVELRVTIKLAGVIGPHEPGKGLTYYPITKSEDN